MAKITKQEALNYHCKGKPGKIEVIPTKAYSTQRDLSMAYTPGVAEPCREIEKNPEDAYKYTAKGNLVAVVSNGTAVLGLGDIGALAGKPVMEGKGLLFKVFADVDVFDIEVDCKDTEKLIEITKAIAPTFGGINLEDIKAPECFEIEERLKKELDIPVFHDDQHGTAIISGAALLNALELNGKNITDLKVVVNGAGASGVSCSLFYISLGVRPENIIMLDSKGVIHTGRKDINEVKRKFARDTKVRTLAEAMEGADLFLGLSVGNIVTRDMVRSMAENPIVFAMANPTPEISYDDALAARNDVIMATGRSDFPNQVNNVLGFPFIFRGALDVRASTINEEMKIAACNALATLAKELVPDDVNKAYGLENLTFGREYLIPKPLDPRLISRVSAAVARAAIDSGVARKKISDWKAYDLELNRRLGFDNQLIRSITEKAKQSPKRVVFAEANNLKVLKAAQGVLVDGIAKPILLGNTEVIRKLIADNCLRLDGVPVIDYRSDSEEERRERYAGLLYERRQRKGMLYDEALDKMYNRDFFGVMMVETGEADAFISGFSSRYAETIRPALQIVGTNNTMNHIAGMYLMITKKGPFFFADCTVNIEPSARTLVDTTLLVAHAIRKFNIEPRIALVSYSNFGSIRDGSPQRAHEAVEILHTEHPDLKVDGEMQANFAFNRNMRKIRFPFSMLADSDINTVIFPNLSSGNIAYKMMQEIGGAEAVGPILLGLNKPVHILQIESSVREIVNMAAIAVVDAQYLERGEVADI
ncbi:MAG: NADP-dependent malic enzyme [Marinilabiliales bacterium]|nr:MAG: NADP-dependent malic enzyme [Marinilabiliales bacterium]